MTTTPSKRLARARKVRQRTSLELKALKMGHVTLSDVLEEPLKTPLKRARVYDVLRHAPHISDTGAKKICLSAQVWPLDKLGELSRWELDELLKYLPPRAK